MRQTMLAFLAMAIFSLLSFSQQRAALRYHGQVYGRDVERAALDFAQVKMAEIESKSFDEIDAANPELRVDVAGLTGNIGPDEDELAVAAFDDIDDYHGFSSPYTHLFNSAEYPFQLDIEVQFVSVSNPSVALTGAASLAKEVTVRVTEQDTPGERAPVVITLKRTMSPAGLYLH
ncbi:MAG: hypothetical protein SH809_02150 [Rhodothermales bacterium]|nr:hypothetical protein [Rhodothermales bacterium]